VPIPLGINVVQGEQVIVSIADLIISGDTKVILEDQTTLQFYDIQGRLVNTKLLDTSDTNMLLMSLVLLLAFMSYTYKT
jgi:hypothetical protein